MSITQVTTWTGTPAAIELLEAASKQSAPFHESLGAKNPRLMRGVTGSFSTVAFYTLDFDSMEAYGAWCDALLQSEWWDTTAEAISDAHPDLEMTSQNVYYDGLTRKSD